MNIELIIIYYSSNYSQSIDYGNKGNKIMVKIVYYAMNNSGVNYEWKPDLII